MPSRARRKSGVFLRPEQITEQKLARVRALNQVAMERGQSLAQLALAWVLRHPAMTSVLIGASKAQQIEDCAAVVNNLAFSQEELQRIEQILA